MEERNELNDIILNRNNSSTSSNKKIVLAGGVLAIILIVVIMIIKSSVANNTDNLPQAQQQIKKNQSNNETQENNPVFQPIEIVKENQKSDDELDKIAQKLKQESLSKEKVPSEAPKEMPAVAKPEDEKPLLPLEKQSAPVAKRQTISQQEPVIKTHKLAEKESIKRKPIGVKKEPLEEKEPFLKQETPSQKESLFKKEENPSTTTIASSKAVIPNKEASQTYYVQVGSFTKNTPSEKYFTSIKNLGYTYQAPKVGAVNKIFVGPFKSEKDARDALKTLRKNVEPGAFITKK